VKRYYRVELEDFWDGNVRKEIELSLAYNFFSENCMYKLSDRYDRITEWIIDSDTMMAATLAGHTEHTGFITITPYASWRTLFKGWL
jgi:hypothetical protein